jgi:hypothetical protein
MKSAIFWGIMPCSPFEAEPLATCFNAGFLLGIFFDPEDGGDIFLRNIGWLSMATLRYIPEDSILHNHCCENLKSYIE